MHSGRFPTLREAAAFYTGGRGHAVPEGESPMIHWHIWEPDLSDEELDRLVDFLRTLTDESFKPRVPEQLPSGMQPVHNDNISSRIIGPPTQIIQALYMDNPQGITEYAAKPVRKLQDYPEMPPQGHLDEETLLTAAEFTLGVEK